MTLIFSHRGASREAPENTMSAFKKALEWGAEGIEMDVQLSKDGTPVIIHDEVLKRTTGAKGSVCDYRANELRKLDAGSWFHPDYAGETIPLLEEFLSWCAATPLQINIELKNNIIPYEGLEQKVLDLVRHYGLSERVTLSSFNHYSIKTLRTLDEHIDLAPLYSSGLFEPWHYARFLGARSAHPYYKTLFPEILQGYKIAGINVRPYTVNSKKWLSYFFKWQTDAVITDDLQTAIELRQRMKDAARVL
ncbi:glycerophosphodiester phosphodiesterase [Fictibacillus iocasae]|uniref:Glycerophosphodiester phosphodiesterase n=1 Tax=Fictibacillus iocasae TaxID=2715437 RepID=A0ABW2NNS0_9BACL